MLFFVLSFVTLTAAILFVNFVVMHCVLARFFKKPAHEELLYKLFVGTVVVVALTTMSAVSITGMIMTKFPDCKMQEVLFIGSMIMSLAAQTKGATFRAKQPKSTS